MEDVTEETDFAGDVGIDPSSESKKLNPKQESSNT